MITNELIINHNYNQDKPEAVPFQTNFLYNCTIAMKYKTKTLGLQCVDQPRPERRARPTSNRSQGRWSPGLFRRLTLLGSVNKAKLSPGRSFGRQIAD